MQKVDFGCHIAKYIHAHLFSNTENLISFKGQMYTLHIST